MKKTTIIKTIGVITAFSLCIPMINVSADNNTEPVSQFSGESMMQNQGFGPGNGGMQGANITMSDSPSDIITSNVVSTASALSADYKNATTITISDNDNEVKISEAGTYIVTGTCKSGNITVKKGTTGVVLILKDLNLTSTTGATVSINKGAEAKIIIEGTVILTDSENPEDENSTDTEVADAFDGAAIKVKDGANVYMCGTGTLVINGECKNGIKSGDEAGTGIVIDGSSITITAANDGINSGYDMTLLSGTINISAEDDAIHADRILTIGCENTESPIIKIQKCNEGLEGTVVNIFSGSIDIQASDDGINAANKNATYVSEMSYSINIIGGMVNVNSTGDGLDSNGNINLIGGTVNIKSTYNGGEAGIDFDGSYYLSDDVTLNNSGGVSNLPEMGEQPGQMNPGGNGQMMPGQMPDGSGGHRPWGGSFNSQDRPTSPGGFGGDFGGGSAASVTYDAEKSISADTEESDVKITSDTADKIALLVNGGTVTENNLTVSKTGDSNGGDSCNFYGQNAAVLAKDGAVLNIDGANITSDASGANGVFSYGGNGGKNGAEGDGTTVNISNSTITTKGNGSGGIMTTGGGITNATNLSITTSGNSSAAIRTDRGGGTVNVDGGVYITNGLGSPVVYSTADITVKNAELVSNLSEGVVIEGKNTVTLENVTLVANNTKTNGNATHYDTIFMYQSMSGDADSGTSVFTMTGGKLTSNNGEVFHVTNTNAQINLNSVSIVNNDTDKVLLTVTNDGWSGSANTAVLNATSQKLAGCIVVSNAAVKDSNKSTLTLNLKSSSLFTGSINSSEAEKGSVNISIDKTSSWKLTADSYVDTLTGNGSINYNGHTLYVNGKAYTEENPYSGFNTVTGDADEEETIQTVVFKNVTKTLKESDLQESKKNYSVIKKSGGGEISVIKYYKDASKYITVSSTGKLTVKKGTPAGTYKVKIKVAEEGGYAETVKTIKIKVK